MTQLCVVIFVLVLSIVCLRVKTSPDHFKKNDDMILHYFLNKL